jgi:hypothetical protein
MKDCDLILEAAAAAQIDFPSVIDTKERKVKEESAGKES